MALEQRLRNIEERLKRQMRGTKCEPQYIDLLDLPKEMIVETFRILKESTQGCQCMLKLDQIEGANSSEYIPFDQFTPEQLYDLMSAKI